MENLAGQQIKGYELKERIAAGGFGAVYRAIQSTVGREVAIKVILPGLANKPDFIRRFEAEAQLIARLEHMNIVPLHDYWRDPDGAYLVMRYLRGGSLHDTIQKQGALTIEEIINLFSQVAQGLHVAHRNQVIHRDIKPGNILLDEDSNAYLADFGIAKDHTTSENITEPDSFIGSPKYLAPEQARSEAVTPQTDIYSLGVVLYEMLSGEHPFPGLERIEVIFKHLNDALPYIDSLEDSICDDINSVIQKATAKDPRQRFTDVVEMMQALRQAAQLDKTPTATSLVELLTPREQEVMQLIIEGKSNREIADILVLTEGTVKQYINSIYRKLKVRSRVQAIVRARELNFVVQKPEVSVSANTGHLPEPENPYKGLQAFQAADAQHFFGREKLIQKLLNRLQENTSNNRFLAVVGPSGSGKSSVVKAGLIPALWRGDLAGSENWYIVDMLPGERPLDELEVALTRIASDTKVNIHEQLERDSHGLHRVANMILPDDKSEILLVIDQFEEVFTLLEDEDDRVHFLHLLKEAVNSDRSRVRVIVTLRADYYDKPLQYPDFGEMMRSRIETVLPLGAEELEQVIREPSYAVGVHFEDGLVSRIVSDVHYQPGALPLLQYALTELFERRDSRTLTQQAYQDIGGTGGALANRADELFHEGSEAHQEMIRQMFLRLVTLGEGAEDTRRRVDRAELLDIASDREMMGEIIDVYADSRLLSLDNDPATRRPTVEVAHEAILREWERLCIWLNDSRDDIRQERDLARATDDWDAHNRDASYLLRGARLEKVEKWQKSTNLILTPLEKHFIDISLSQREDEAVEAIKRNEREKKLEKRSQNFLRALVAIFALSTIISGGFGIFALTQRQSALNSTSEVQNVALIAGSQAALANNDTDTALALAWQAVSINPESSLSQAQLSEVAYSPGTVRRYSGHNGGVDVVTLSPDETTMLSASWDGTLILWEINTGEILRTYEGHSDMVWAVAMSPDGRYAVSGSKDTTVILWDVQTGSIIRRFEDFENAIVWVDFHPDGQSIIASGKGTRPPLIQWDVATGEIIHRYEGHSSAVETIRFTPDGNQVLSGSEDGTVILWDVQSGDIIYRINPGLADSAGAFRVATISPDGETALIGYSNLDMFLLDLDTGEILRRYTIDLGGIFAIAFHPEDDIALVGGITGILNVIDLQSGLILDTFAGHSAGIFDIKFKSDGRYALTASPDGTLRMWDLNRGQLIRSFAEPHSQLFEVDLSPDGLTAISGTADGTVTLWDVETGEIIHQFTDDQPIMAVKFSPDGQTAIIGTGYRLGEEKESGHIILWDLETGQEIRRFIGQPYVIFDAEFSPDGTTLITSGNGAIVILWDVETGQEIWRFEDYWIDSPYADWAFLDVEFSPDGNTILAAYSDGSIIILNPENGSETGQLQGHQRSAIGIAFNNSGLLAVSGGLDNQVILWDMQTGSILRRLTNHAAIVTQVRFSPDERFILGGSGDGTNSLWNAETGEVIRRYTEGHVQVPVFSPDGHQALAGFRNGTLELWRIDTTLDELLAWTQANRYVPALTCEQRALYIIEPLCQDDS